MPIEKGSEWGSIVNERSGGIDAIGDVARDLGVADPVAAASGVSSGRWRRLPLDRIDFVLRLSDGSSRELSGVSWLQAGRRLRGRFVVVSSTSHVDGRRLFARAHPNDGRLDWLRIDPAMRLRERTMFWRRTRTESHLPHPMVVVGAAEVFSQSFDRPVTIRSGEGVRLDNVVELTAHVIPDATHTHIPAQ